MDCHLMVGDKVVCVDDQPNFYRTGYLGRWEAEITVGNIYTVAWIGQFDHSIIGPFIGVRLREVDRKDEDVPFWPDRFRRVVDTTETVAEMARLMRQATKETVG